MLLIGIVVLSLACLHPLLDTRSMLINPTVLFFIGHEIPLWIVITFVGWLMYWIISVVLFFSCAREETHTETSIISLVAMTLTGLGVCVLLQAHNLDSTASSVITNIYTNCGSNYAEFVAVSTSLQQLRQSDACKNQESVEDCTGYEATEPWTGLLKYMELNYKCAGFCYSSYNITAANQTQVAKSALFDTQGSSSPLSLTATQVVVRLHSQIEEPVLLARHRHERAKGIRRGTLAGAIDDLAHPARQGRKDHGVGMLSTRETIAKGRVRVPGNGTLSNSTLSNSTYVTYPPTLFSLNNYQASCDAMAAHDIQWTALQPAATLYVGALTLILCSVVVPLGKLMTMCKDGRHYKERMRRASGQH